MSIIKPEYLTLDGLFQRKIFEIPDYQRTYSWEKKHREELFADIEKIASVRDSDNDRHHFMSTIVCLHKVGKHRSIGTTKFESLEIVDGQQRITTLIILLRAIGQKLNKINKIEKKEWESINELLVKDDKQLLLLQSNHDNKQVFRDYLQTGTKPEQKSIATVTDQNLSNAFKECELFVKEWSSNIRVKNKNNRNLLGLLSIVKNRLGFVFYTVEEPGAVYNIFEVLNSRGRRVDSLDKAKSKLMGFVYENFPKDAVSKHLKELHEKWQHIYRIIGKSDVSGEEIVKFSATLYNPDPGKKPMSSEDSLKYFLEVCHKNKNEVFDIVNHLCSVTEKLKEIYESRQLKAVTDILHARLSAVAIKLSKYTTEEKQLLLEQWERTSFRIFGIYRMDSRTAVGAYITFSKNVLSRKFKVKEMMKELKSVGKDFSIKKIEDKLWRTDCYNNWEEELRYFFYKYEDHLCKENKAQKNIVWDQIWRESPLRSIEHIFPQTPKAAWKGKLGKGINYENHIHRLGNLVLLTPGMNSSIQNQGFSEKRKKYSDQNMSIVREITRKNDWTLSTIEAREKKLIAWAKETWCDLDA